MFILATDFDGTLNRGGISQEDRDAIDKFRSAGNLFGVVTGRDCYMYETLIAERLGFDFVIVMNGAMALDAGGGVIYEEIGDGGCVRGVVELIGDGYGHQLSCVRGRDRLTFHSRHPDGNDRYAPMSRLCEIDSFTMMNTWVDTDELARQAVLELNEGFGSCINALQNGNCIDIPPRGIDKGVGVARYAEKAGVPHENIWCAGDNLNDMAMITRFHGCAVSNARAEVKAAAEAVYDGIHAIIGEILSRGKIGKCQ